MLGDLTVERVDILDNLVRLRQLVLEVLTRCSHVRVLALGSGPQLLDLSIVRVDEDKLASDVRHHGLKGVFIGVGAENNDLASRRPALHAMIEVVVVHQESDMASSNACSHHPRRAKSGSEGSAYIDDSNVGDYVVKQLWASGLDVDGLSEGDLDVSNVSVAENVLAADRF
jgi:hypothetical protein